MSVKKISFGNGQFNQFMLMPAQNQQQQLPSAPINTQAYPSNSSNHISDSSKTIAYISSAVAIASMGLSAAVLLRSGFKGSKNTEKAADKMNELILPLKNEMADLRAKSDLDAKLNERLGGITDWVKGLEQKLNEKNNWFDNWLKDVDSKIKEKSDYSVGWLKALEERVSRLAARTNEAGLSDRNLAKAGNLPLLQNIGVGGKRIMLPPEAAKEIREIAQSMINKSTDIPKLDKNAVTWSITAESIPEKEGGLGEVPVQIAKNMTKELCIKNFLVRPLNEIPGVSSIVAKDGKWYYKYKDLEMPVFRVASFDVPAFRNGRAQTESVDVFYGRDPKFGFERLMFRNKDYFGASGLYRDSQLVSEKERYAFFPRAVYEFMKMKLDPNSMSGFKIYNEELYNMIPAPDTLLLNDWHAAAMPGLTKLLSTAEAANGELSAAAAAKLKKMNNLEIIHSLEHQGEDNVHSADILNTLYGKYAYDIYTTAETGLSPDNLKNIHVIDGRLNLANIAASLANKLKPVSPTYAEEIAKDPVRSRALQHIMSERFDKGSMKGQSNGWDRSVNELNAKNINDINNNLNSDKFSIIKRGIDNLNLTTEQRDSVKVVFNPKDSNAIKFQYNNTEKILTSLRKLGFPKLTEFLDKMDTDGVTKLRTFVPMIQNDNIDVIMAARLENKKQFIEYMQSMISYNKTHSKFFNIAEEGVTDLSHVNMDDLDNQIVINCGTRFVSQKGIDILVATMKDVLREWPQKYPGKPKPIFAVGGADGEGGKWEALMKHFKAEMGKDADTVPYMIGYAPNNVFHAGSDLTLYPSHYEPDGSKWESLYKGTPVVATRVGGHVDSIIDGYNGFLSKRTVPEAGASGYDFLGTMVYDFKEALYRGIDTFFDKSKYKDMVRHAIDGDESWLIKDKHGKFIGGSLLGHLEDLGYNLDDFPIIASATARKAYVDEHKAAIDAVKKAQNAVSAQSS